MDAPGCEVQCDVCGYPRTGLVDQALCPECGEPPPAPVRTGGRTVGRTHHAPVDGLSAGRIAHARAVSVGLFLLVLSSISAVGTTLYMEVGPVTIPALNVPAPKIHGAALVQRSIGGRPGPVGVSGSCAVLLGVLAVWLITTPRSLTAGEESTFSLRRLARWSAVVGVGGALGFLVARSDIYLPKRGAQTAAWLAMVVVFCELPANGLLYAYLRKLSAEWGDRRASAGLDRAAWMVPCVTAGAGAMIVYAMMLYAMRSRGEWPMVVRGAAGIYAAVAMGVGAAATAGVLRLLATTSAVAFDGWAVRGLGVVGRLPRGVRQGLDAVRGDPGRWAVLAGLLLWVWNYWHVIGIALSLPSAYSQEGRVPMIEFPGPKVPLTAFSGDAAERYGWYSSYGFNMMVPSFAILGAVWLMTWPTFRSLRPAPAVWTRRVLLGLCGIAIALGTMRAVPIAGVVRHPRVLAFAVSAMGSVATVLVYLRLAAVAGALGRRDLGRRLMVFGIVGAALNLVPLGMFRFTAYVEPRSFSLGVLCAVQVATMMLVTFACFGALARLGWVLVADGALRRTAGQAALADDFEKIVPDRPVPVLRPAENV